MPRCTSERRGTTKRLKFYRILRDGVISEVELKSDKSRAPRCTTRIQLADFIGILMEGEELCIA